MSGEYWRQSSLDETSESLSSTRHAEIEYRICEDFFADPTAVRELLLALRYQPPPDPIEGVISFNALIPAQLSDEILARCSGVLGGEVEMHPRSKIAATYEHVPLNNVCHVDGGDNMCMFNWTVVVYMNTHDQCRGGTRLYRHIPTGDICNVKGWSHYSDDSRDPGKWEMIEEVQMKFNRALFLPAWRFHSLAYTFGTSIDTARLTVNPKIIAL